MIFMIQFVGNKRLLGVKWNLVLVALSQPMFSASDSNGNVVETQNEKKQVEWSLITNVISGIKGIRNDKINPIHELYYYRIDKSGLFFILACCH